MNTAKQLVSVSPKYLKIDIGSDILNFANF